MKSANNIFFEVISAICDDISQGLLYIHTRINTNTAKTLETASFLYALIEIMNEKGMMSIDELDECKKQVTKRLVRNFV